MWRKLPPHYRTRMFVGFLGFGLYAKLETGLASTACTILAIINAVAFILTDDNGE
jgi:hypothetical protein